MALSATRLINALVDALDAAGAYDDSLNKAAAKAKSREMFEILCDEVIDEIVNNAVVNVTVSAGILVTTDPVTGIGSTTSTGTGQGGVS